MKVTTTEEVKPCRHVQHYVEGQATGKPRRWWNFFGWLHVKHCPQCQEALRRLQTYFQDIVKSSESNLDQDSQDIMNQIRSKFAEEGDSS